jgi:Family of unknown function (DUF6152)
MRSGPAPPTRTDKRNVPTTPMSNRTGSSAPMSHRWIVLTALACLALPPQLSAHHSFAMFDLTRKIELKGTVLAFEWSSPHIWIQLLVHDAASNADTEWSVEAPSIPGLMRLGWRADSLKYGDHVTLYIHPLKAGGPGGALQDAILPDGHHLGQTSGQVGRDGSGPAR